VSKKNIHIKKYLKGNLPEPEVQADDAWAKMDDMLGVNSVPETQISTVNKLKFLLKGGLGIVTAVGIATSIWFLVPEDKSKNLVKQNKENSLPRSNAVQSLPENTHKELSSTANEQQIDSLQYSQILEEKKERKLGLENSERLTITDNASNISQESAYSKTDSGYHGLSQKRNNGEINVSETEFNKSSARIKAESEVNRGHSKKTDEYSGVTEKVENKTTRGQRNKQPFSSGNESEKINITSENRFLLSAKTLVSKPLHFNNSAIKQTRLVSYSQPASAQNQKFSKEKKSLLETLHAGLEWNASSPFNSTKYILKGTDSTSKPYLLLIPGIWISKDITENQLVRLSFYANQPFYGGLKRVQRIGADSALFHNNINLIKATGVNLALQYEYRFFQKILASAGFSYSPLRKALAQDDYENYQGIIIHGPKLILNKQNISQYINTDLFLFKTGLTFTPGRYQFGANMLIPLSNLSLTPTSSLRTLNGQFFFRFTIK